MHKTLSLLCIFALAACGSQKSAKIVMHDSAAPQTILQPEHYPSDAPFKPVFGVVKQSQPAPVKEMTIKELTPPERKPRSDAGGVELRKDDTLYTFARRHGIPAKQVAEANDLKAPYDISGMKTLKLSEAEQEVATVAAALEQPVATPVAENVVTSAPVPRFKPEAKQASAVVSEKGFAVRPQFNSKGKFIWPVAGKVISRFGAKDGGLYNDGVNIAAAEGASVYASMDGTVVYVGDELASYGNLLILKHKNGWLTAYAHTKEILVKKGQKVKLGQVVALVGQTGNVPTPQIHFGIRDGKKALDPLLKVRG